MPQTIYGGASPSSLQLDDVYIAVQQPQPVLGTGSTSFQGGCSGFAQWGPKNSPVSCQTPQALIAAFGLPLGSGQDIVQDGALFLNQFPQGGVSAVRVTDGTDQFASATINDGAGVPAPALKLSALYTGTFGNSISVTQSVGSNSTAGAPTIKIVVQAGTNAAETFDRIPAPTVSPGQVWVNAVAAINTGSPSNGGLPSRFVVAALPTTPSSSAAAAAGATVTLTGGTNGGPLTSAAQLGTDGGAGARTGIFALRGSKCDTYWLCGVADSTTWSALAAFAQSESGMGVGSIPTGTSVAAAITAKLAAGIDNAWFTLAKDFVTYLDTYLGKPQVLAPSCIVAGTMSRQAPHNSPGNTQVYGIIGTEATLGANPQPYSNADLGALETAGIVLITNPIPAAQAFGLRFGKNTSSNFATSEIAYTRKTNDLVRAFGGPILGQFINRLQSTAANDPLRDAVQAALNGYLAPQVVNGQIAAFSVKCDLTNNPVAAIQAGQLRADVIVQYLAVVNKFVINLTAGQTVLVTAVNQVSGV